MRADPYDNYCEQQRSSDRWRELRAVDPAPAGRLTLDGRELLNFSSNDYLGLAHHPELTRRAAQWAREWGTGVGASRLVCGNLEPFERIEARLARAKGTEAALVLNSGFQANSTLLPALLDPAVLGGAPRVYSDRLNHASIHHGLMAAGVRQLRYRHADLDHLETLLRRDAALPGRRFILSETVFSMDGDRAPVAGLVELAERHDAFLFLDEAHATGVLGPGGFGLAGEFPGRVDLVMGTFSKALGAFGGYVACSKRLREYLVNRCAGLIYSTALPPPVLGAIDAALELVPTMDAERRALQEGAAEVRAAFEAAGLDTAPSSTQIIPVRIGDERAALEASRRLEQQGVLAGAIRPPTVPPGTSRLRFSLTAAHGAADRAALVAATLRALPPGRPG